MTDHGVEKLTIRAATRQDVTLILRFIQALADYEREPDAVTATEADLEATLFCDNPRAFCVLCEADGEALGFAIYFFNYSTWLGKHGLYLEDLFVTPEHRGRGAGRALLQHLARIAVAEGCGRMEWNVLDWNQPAIDFYRSFGAEPLDEWTIHRLTGDALHAFAHRSN